MHLHATWPLRPPRHCADVHDAVTSEQRVTSLLQAMREAVKTQGAKTTADAAWFRLVAMALFVPLACYFAISGRREWFHALPLLAVYGTYALFCFVVRRRAWATTIAPLSWLFDVVLVFSVQARGMEVSGKPAGVAGFTLGLYALLITLSASAMSPLSTTLTACAACVAQVMLMRMADVGTDAQLIAVATLAVAAFSNQHLMGQLRKMAMSLTDFEVERRLNADRFEALESAKRTIEEMLEVSAKQNEALKVLQDDKESFAQLLVHDLRSPLGAVVANLQWLEGELKDHDDPEIRAAIQQSRSMTTRLAAMIGDLLNLSKLEAHTLTLVREPLEVSDLLGQVRAAVSAQGRGRNITVEMKAPDGLEAELDRSLLIRVVENLASNALRYTPLGGRVHLEAREEGCQLLLIVSNDGHPISMEARSRIFEKFEQAGSPKDSRRAGWGLGLYFCRLAVGAHHGTIAVEDEPGWATSFVIRLPLQPTEPLRAAA